MNTCVSRFHTILYPSGWNLSHPASYSVQSTLGLSFSHSNMASPYLSAGRPGLCAAPGKYPLKAPSVTFSGENNLGGLKVACQVTDQVGNESLLKDLEENHIPTLTSTEIIARLHNNVRGSPQQHLYRAMFSSILGGIITEPAMMLVPIDDHIVHRGHGVFDTALIVNGCLYELDAHLDRLLKSASMARINSPFDCSTLKNILVQTVAASNCRQGTLRYWLSAGPGGFKLSSSECKCASFYAIVIEEQLVWSVEGVKVITSTIPMKPPEFATMKNVNYLPNALSKMEAEDQGAYAGIWLDGEGYIAEGPNMNVAFVSQSGVLLMPSFDKILSGCTAKRLLALAPKLVSGEEIDRGLLKDIRVGQISVTEAKDAAEMMLIGSGLPVRPVIQWDQQLIGDGQPGPVTIALLDLLTRDMLHGPLTLRQPVSYRDKELDRH